MEGISLEVPVYLPSGPSGRVHYNTYTADLSPEKLKVRAERDGRVISEKPVWFSTDWDPFDVRFFLPSSELGSGSFTIRLYGGGDTLFVSPSRMNITEIPSDTMLNAPSPFYMDRVRSMCQVRKRGLAEGERSFIRVRYLPLEGYYPIPYSTLISLYCFYGTP